MPLPPSGPGPPGYVEYRFRDDPRTIRGFDASDVVATLRLRVAVGFPSELAEGPLGPFCAAFSARSGAPYVDPGLPDHLAAAALLRSLESVGIAARVGPGRLRIVERKRK